VGPGQGTPSEVDLVEGEGSWDDWGAREERRGYSAEEIRRARILPDLPWGRSVRGLSGTWRRGRGGWVRVQARTADQARCTRERGAFARNATVPAEGYAGPVF